MIFNEKISKQQQSSEENINALQTELKHTTKLIQERDNRIEDMQKELLEFYNLKLRYRVTANENEFMRSKLEFFEATGAMPEKEKSSRIPVPSAKINAETEKFDNFHLKDLIDGSEINEAVCESKIPASILQERNSKVASHLKDSYFHASLDSSMTEQEIKVCYIKCRSIQISI